MAKKRKRKTPRRRRQHWATGSAMMIDRRQGPERRAKEIEGKYYMLGPGDTIYPIADGNLTEI